MKKIFLYLFAVSLTFSSCSKDDSSSSASKKITMTIGGQVKSFNTISVTEDVYDVGTVDEYTDLIVLATNDAGTETISISLEKEITGTDAIYYFSYSDGENDYYATDSFNTNVTVNNSSKNLKGTFSGILQGPAMGSTLAVTNGTFDINY